VGKAQRAATRESAPKGGFWSRISGGEREPAGLGRRQKRKKEKELNAEDAEFAEARRNLKIKSCGHGAQQCCAPTFLWVIVAALVAVGFAFVPHAIAQRKPVLRQIELPHPYYYREMYLPVLTSGPSSVAWSPDSREVIYSMGGALWRQRVDSNTAQQITDGAGYDYQPDWSRDGKSVVYVSYQDDAMELWVMDLATGDSRQVTRGGAVNVEPRWSPDGKKIVFVSTEYHGRFHIFVMDAGEGFAEGKASAVRLTEETKSTLPRYYYAEYDTEIHPTWSRDGAEILFVSNRGHIYGRAGFGGCARRRELRLGRFITKRRRGRRGRTFRRMGRRFCIARIWEGSGINFG
jgi:hypothetical protein